VVQTDKRRVDKKLKKRNARWKKNIKTQNEMPGR
jgi:hypothetical protein